MPGAATVARGSVIQRLDWSPTQALLAATIAGKDPGTGRIELFRPDGTAAGTVPGIAGAWVDGDRMVVLDPVGDSRELGSGAARVVDVASGTGVLVGDTLYSGLLGNGRGRVALVRAPTSSDAEATTDIWSDRGLEPAPLGGTPVAWSPDGGLLVFASAPRRPLPGTGSTGGPDLARLVALALPSHERRFDTLDQLVDTRMPVTFSPGGAHLAAASAEGTVVFDPDGTPVIELKGYVPYRWTPAGDLVVVSDDEREARLLGMDGVLSVPPTPPGIPAYGPEGAVAVLQPGETATGGAILVGRGEAWQAIPGVAAGQGTPLAWTADGSACFVATGTADASLDRDRLLRVPIP